MRKVLLQESVPLDALAGGPGGGVDVVPASTRGDGCVGREPLALKARDPAAFCCTTRPTDGLTLEESHVCLGV